MCPKCWIAAPQSRCLTCVCVVTGAVGGGRRCGGDKRYSYITWQTAVFARVCVCVCKPFDPFRLDPNQLCTQYVVVAVVVHIVRDPNQCARKCDCRNSATNSIFAPHYDYNYRVPS